MDTAAREQVLTWARCDVIRSGLFARDYQTLAVWLSVPTVSPRSGWATGEATQREGFAERHYLATLRLLRVSKDDVLDAIEVEQIRVEWRRSVGINDGGADTQENGR
jgi:hypothetical protein